MSRSRDQSEPGGLPARLEVFDQTWEITPDALKVFHFAGINSLDALKLLIIRLGSRSGLPEGEYLVNYFRIELKIVSKGEQVSVFDPYYPP